MSESQKPSPRQLHRDFPNEPILSAIGGSQLKLTIRRTEDGTYASPRRSPEEIMHRFEAAEELLGQLVSYFQRKKLEFPEWTDSKNLERIRLALVQKARQGKWPYTDAEQAWIIARLRERCNVPLEPAHLPESLTQGSSEGPEGDVSYQEKAIFNSSAAVPTLGTCQ